MNQTAMRQIVQAVVDHALPLARAVDTIVTQSAAPARPDPILELLHQHEIAFLIQLAAQQQCTVGIAVHGILQCQRIRQQTYATRAHNAALG